MTIGLCTDSNAQLPEALVERFDIEVVPVTVTVDGEDVLDGLDLDSDEFYAHFTADRRPVITIGEPSPGQFALAYDHLVARGCTEILSVHIASSVSGTANAARLATRSVDVPVRLVDAAADGFALASCLWAAAEAIAAGASVSEAASIAERVAPSVGNVFVVGAADDSIPVLTLVDGQVQAIDRVASMVDAVNAMAAFAVRRGTDLKVGVGHADRSAAPMADALAAACGETASVAEVLHFRVSPAVGAHTGPGTTGLFVFSAVTFPGAPEPSTPATS
jgi:fatty acid-binding protein DegV